MRRKLFAEIFAVCGTGVEGKVKGKGMRGSGFFGKGF